MLRELVRRDRMVINDEDEDSNTALHLAALSGHNKVTAALIEAGADIEARWVYLFHSISLWPIESFIPEPQSLTSWSCGIALLSIVSMDNQR